MLPKSAQDALRIPSSPLSPVLEPKILSPSARFPPPDTSMTNEASRNGSADILLYGNPVFAAHGMGMESMGIHSLPDCGTGGIIHIITNNRTRNGFTTNPRLTI